MISLASPDIRQEEVDRVKAVLSTGLLADGPEVRGFEQSFADTVASDHAVATSNGTTALHAALVGLDIGPGDTVITTPFSFIASANAARLAGASVDFVDIEPTTLNIDPEALESRLRTGEDIDAVIPVHLFGLPADIDHIVELSNRYDFAVIEDAAQAHGATHRGRPVGSIGDVGCFSFYPTKNITAAEGGMITTNDEALAQRIRQYIDHGRTGRYAHDIVGHNFRLSSIHAAIGRAQLDRLPDYVKQRRRNAAQLTDSLAHTPIQPPVDPPDRAHAYHQYTIRHGERDRIQEFLSARDIESAIYYPTPIHQQPAYNDITVSCPNAEAAASEVLSIPVHPGVHEQDIDRIQRAVTSAVEAPA